MTKAIPYVPYAGAIVTRSEARAQGASRYFTGKSCKNGHVAQRIAVNGSCVFCMRATWKIYHAANPDNSERAKERKRRWAEDNRQKGRDYYRANAERFRESFRAYKKANPDKISVWNRNRRARKRAAEGKHSREDVAEIFTHQRGRCAYCRKRLGKGFHVDHITPIDRGGSNDRRNLQITCAFCNVSKHNADPIDFAQRLGRLV